MPSSEEPLFPRDPLWQRMLRPRNTGRGPALPFLPSPPPPAVTFFALFRLLAGFDLHVALGEERAGKSAAAAFGQAGRGLGERGVLCRVGLLLEGGQHAGGGRAQGREVQRRQAAGMLLQTQDILDRERRAGHRAREHGGRCSGAAAGAPRERRLPKGAAPAERPALACGLEAGREAGPRGGGGGGTLPLGSLLIGPPGRHGRRGAACPTHLI